jgi:hypothetical protein
LNSVLLTLNFLFMKSLFLALCAMLFMVNVQAQVSPQTVVTPDYTVTVVTPQTVVTPSHNTQVIVVTDHTPSWQEQRATIVVPNQNQPSWVTPPANSVPANNTPSWTGNTWGSSGLLKIE